MWTDDEEFGSPGEIIRTKGHQSWFLEHPKWLISALAAARVEATEDYQIVLSAILRGTEPVSALTRALFILLRSL